MSRLVATTEREVNEGLRPETAVRPLRWAWQRWHLWLLLIGLLLRVGFCLATDREASFAGWDGKEYYAYAQSLLALRGDDYPRYFNAIRPPLYPIFLTPFVAASDHVVWPIQLTQALLGLLQAFLLAKIAGRWAGQRAGNWAFGIALLHPFLIYFPAFILTETLFITLLWAGLACLQKWDGPQMETRARWLYLSALALGLGCLTRPALQPFLVVAVVWIGWRTGARAGWPSALKRMTQFTIIVSALLLPWMIANYRRHGDITLAPRTAQAMYALANSPDYLRMYEAHTKAEYYRTFEQLVARYSVESGTSPEQWAEEARDFRQHQRAAWWRLQWYKFRHFWTPWLNPLIFPRTQFLLSVLSATPLFLLAAAELFRRRRTLKRDPFLLLMLGLIGVGYLVAGFLFHVQVRYRIPFVDLTCIILTASLLGQLTLRKVAAWKLVKLLRPAEAL